MPAFVEICELCHEPVEPTHELIERNGCLAVICPSFAEFVLDGSHAIRAADDRSRARHLGGIHRKGV